LSVGAYDEDNVCWVWSDLPKEYYKVSVDLYCNSKLCDHKEKNHKDGGHYSPTTSPLTSKTTVNFQCYDNGTVIVRINSPVKVKDAQIVMEIPEEVKITSYDANGFMKGCIYLSSGMEHRWFVLPKRGDYQGLLKIKTSPYYELTKLKLSRICFKDEDGNSIPIDAEFPMIPEDGCFKRVGANCSR